MRGGHATFHAPQDDAPDWESRSDLVLSPGLWRMRNGHTANIQRRADIPYRDGRTGKAKVYSIWCGICMECATPMSWTFNGCYAAIGRHRNDILGPA